MRRALCFIAGHKPRGPTRTWPDVTYHCSRCHRSIIFEARKGWKVV